MSVALDQLADLHARRFEGITLATTIESLGLDSIATMELVGHVEDELDITFPDEDLATVSTLADLGSLMRREVG